MKKRIISLLFILVLFLGSSASLMAQPVTKDVALTVAKNWIAVIIAKKGSWGTSETAEIVEIVDLSRKGYHLGYFCKVKPKGYIIISRCREMAPVKAYSATSELDPLSEEGMADLLKGRMERLLKRIEVRGNKAAIPDDLFEIDYRPTWNALINGDLGNFLVAPAQAPERELRTGGRSAMYQEGEVLLSSNWHQAAPYNNDCPDLGCSHSNGHALVGCVATSGAQIMRYWHWPPYGSGSFGGVNYSDTYDWANMPDNATTVSSVAEQAAVAELSYEVGAAVLMWYGCDTSLSYVSNMETAYENNYRYSTSVQRHSRIAYSAEDWFSLMRNEFNYNRPVHYRIYGHSIVGDGWQIVGDVKMYHMNYGWAGTNSDTWYPLDSMSDCPECDDYLLKPIMPSTCLYSLTGTYVKETFRYRYFYRDTVGGSGTFAGGQCLQFLPGVVAKCTNGTVRIENDSSWSSRLFTRGDVHSGIFMTPTSTSAAIKMHPNGGIKFH
ncbi:C10 family peptidase [bacterium]|nr:C10 family peptidase [bacterium]